MTLLTGLRNLIGLKKAPPPEATPANGHEFAQASIEDKPALHVVGIHDDEVLEPEPEPEIEGDRTVEIVRDLDDRLQARAGEVKHLVEGLAARLETHTADARRLGEHLEPRLEAHALETKRLIEQVETRLETHAAGLAEERRATEERLARVVDELGAVRGRCERVLTLLAEQGEGADTVEQRVEAAVDRAASRLADALRQDDRPLQEIRDQVAANTTALDHVGDRSESLAHNLRQLAEGLVRLHKTLADIGQSLEHRETSVLQMIARTRRSMTLFAFACTLASLLALVMAVVALVV